MSKLLFAAPLLFLFFHQGPWEEYKSYDGRFRMLAPGPVKTKITPMKTDIGSIEYHTFYVETTEKDADNIVYLVSYCDYPEGSVHSDSTELREEFFKTTIESSVISVNGTLRYSSDDNLDGFPGKIWRVDYNKGNSLIKSKCYLVKNRYYCVQVVSHREKSLNTASDKFLESFHFLY